VYIRRQGVVHVLVKIKAAEFCLAVLVELLWWVIGPSPDLYLHRTLQIHNRLMTYASGIQTRYPSVREAEHSTCLMARSHNTIPRYTLKSEWKHKTALSTHDRQFTAKSTALAANKISWQSREGRWKGTGRRHVWRLIHCYKESMQNKWWTRSTVFSTRLNSSHAPYRQYESVRLAVQSKDRW
jgi:hypothetical protein